MSWVLLSGGADSAKFLMIQLLNLYNEYGPFERVNGLDK